jgi:non-heme Fe2+,alpha-ketoglutarate-dependent halogenase
MSKILADEAVVRYGRDGYHFPIEIMSSEEAAGLRHRLEAFETRNGGPIAGALRHRPHLLFPWLNALVRDPRILDAVEDVLGPDLFCWSTTFFIKEPGDRSFVSWHQDATYWGLSSPDVMTVWLALTPADLENGCMKFLPGSHARQIAHRDTFASDNLLTRGQEVAVEVDEAQAVTVALRPGQASLHHVLLVHGSAPNRSEDRRIGFAIRYIPTHIRQIAGATDSATLVRGVDRYSHFEHEPRPAAECDAAALAAHAAATARQQQVLYRGTGVAEYRR